jgi:HPt (histidine-containing phosphotransfer) domain-containing protein
MDPLASFRSAFAERVGSDLEVLRQTDAARPSQAAVYAVHRIASMAGVLGHERIGELALSMDEHARETGGFAENDLSALIEALAALA